MDKGEYDVLRAEFGQGVERLLDSGEAMLRHASLPLSEAEQGTLDELTARHPDFWDSALPKIAMFYSSVHDLTVEGDVPLPTWNQLTDEQRQRVGLRLLHTFNALRTLDPELSDRLRESQDALAAELAKDAT